jgi:hypothetical protein
LCALKELTGTLTLPIAPERRNLILRLCTLAEAVLSWSFINVNLPKKLVGDGVIVIIAIFGIFANFWLLRAAILKRGLGINFSFRHKNPFQIMSSGGSLVFN